MQDLTPPSLRATAGILSLAPPSVTHAAALISATQNYEWFRDTVLDLLEEDAEEILSGRGDAEKVETFAMRFESRYFPLCDGVISQMTEEMEQGDNESIYSMLRTGIPCEMLGIEDQDYHEMWTTDPHGVSAIALLVQIEHAPGIRVPWLDEAEEHIPRETLMRIPEGGIPRNQIVAALNGTHLEGVKQALEWLFSDSGNTFVDISYATYYESPNLPWDRETVEELKTLWDDAQPITRAMYAVSDWLEKDLPARFSEMLDLILSRVTPAETEGEK